MFTTTPPKSVIVFENDDASFFRWLDTNSDDGYFLNSARHPKTYLTLHLASCGHIGRLPRYGYTKARVKLCSLNRTDLERWARQETGTGPTLCRTCFG